MAKENKESRKLLQEAYRSRYENLRPLLQKIEAELQKRDKQDETLLRAKKVVTSKLVSKRN